MTPCKVVCSVCVSGSHYQMLDGWVFFYVTGQTVWRTRTTPWESRDFRSKEERLCQMKKTKCLAHVWCDLLEVRRRRPPTLRNTRDAFQESVLNSRLLSSRSLCDLVFIAREGVSVHTCHFKSCTAVFLFLPQRNCWMTSGVWVVKDENKIKKTGHG